MVLRKERTACGVEGSNISKSSNNSSNSTMSNEQPVTKRQRIDSKLNITNNGTSVLSTKVAENETETTPPDIIAGPSSSSNQHSKNGTASSAAIINNNNHSSNHQTQHSSAVINDNVIASSTDEVDRVNILQNIPDLLQTSSSCTSTGAVTNEMDEFQNYLVKQCLCDISERTLHQPFQGHYHQDINGVTRVAKLCEWPTHKLLQFLSNLQLLFDVYLKQNSKGNICSRIMDVCVALIRKRNDHNHLIDEIIELARVDNKYVQFLSGRVLASFLVVAKNNMEDSWLKELIDNWLEKLVDNLFSFERLDLKAVRQMNFSLETIKRIVEWNDVETHPLDDDNDDATDEQQENFTAPSPPPIENNYFARNFNNDMLAVASTSSSITGSNNYSITNDNYHRPNSSSSRSGSGGASIEISERISSNGTNHDHNHMSLTVHNNRTSTTSASVENTRELGCHAISLSDSESFDTTHLKCLTIKILENKWPALVENMNRLITAHRDLAMSESCIITFLCLWENIISVRANLSIVETRPFHTHLDFGILLEANLSCTIYQQMLSLFNEALCYGSTLALQDLLPEETRRLAQQIFRHIYQQRRTVLDALPRRQQENEVGLCGYKGSTVSYETSTFEHVDQVAITHAAPQIDRTILQKMILLVLKSVAVLVKEIRSDSDSSDSSVSSSGGHEGPYDNADEDMELIGQSIREVLTKLENFIKETLNFHPRSHFSEILINLFNDQDDHMIEAMVCTLDVTIGISFRNNALPDLVEQLNPVRTFLEFLNLNSSDISTLMLDYLVSNETCFLLYLLRFLKYIRRNWEMFKRTCYDFGRSNALDNAMSVLKSLREKISELVSQSRYPYDISPILISLEKCEILYEGNELGL